MEMQTSRQNTQPVLSSIINDQFERTNMHIYIYINNELVVRNKAAMMEITIDGNDGNDKNGRAR